MASQDRHLSLIVCGRNSSLGNRRRAPRVPILTLAACLLSFDAVLAARPTSSQVQRPWRETLPTLAGHDVVLRDLHANDATSLLAFLGTAEVTRFLSPPPDSVHGFERFIEWAAHERSAGTHACFAVTLPTSDAAIGIFQVRKNRTRSGTGEWGFAIGSPFWGTGVFEHGAALALGFAFAAMDVHRLEARTAARNGRGNRALQKLGAVRQGYSRELFSLRGERCDQVQWAMFAEDSSLPAVDREGQQHIARHAVRGIA
jgi:ribosomal-protein-alanine N-acetyltransferase